MGNRRYQLGRLGEPGAFVRAKTPLLLRLDSASAAPPLFEQIYEQLRTRILASELAPGAPLPSSRRLAADLGVSRTTVLAAFEALVTEGYLTSAPRSAIRVAPDLPDAPPATATRATSTPLTPPRLAKARAAPAAAGTPRLSDAPRAFRPGVPALDLFPIAAWARTIAAAHARARPSTLEAADPAGLSALRAAIATHVASARGVRCRPEQVFVTTGMQQTIDEVLRLVADPGDPVWIEDPGYLGTRRAAAATGARLVPVPVDGEGLDVAAGAARAPDARAILVTPSHHYPLGVTTSLARRMALLAFAARARSVVIEDDYDSEFRHQGRPIMSLAGLDERGLVVYAGTFSKTLYPGLRIGFAIAPPPLVDAYAAARRLAGNPASILEQAALAEFLESGQFARHLRRMRLVYRERAEAFTSALAAHTGLRPGPCDTGMQACATTSRSDRRLRAAAAASGLEVGALSDYFVGRARDQGLVFGFGCVRPTALVAGCRTLARVLETR